MAKIKKDENASIDSIETTEDTAETRLAITVLLAGKILSRENQKELIKKLVANL